MQIKKHIPNSITSCNLICGAIATTFAVGGNATAALAFIILGAVFDFFDGMSARLLGVSSPIGKELDSLADDITFGLAPSTIVFSELRVMDYPSFIAPIHEIVPYVAFIMAAFSALRLAKFNLDERQALGFIGLPTPANALFWGALIVGCPDWIESSPWTYLVVLAMVFVCSWLLVSEIPMFALKFKHWGWKGNQLRYSFIALAAIVIIFRTITDGVTGFLSAWWIVILLYVIVSIVSDSLSKKDK